MKRGDVVLADLAYSDRQGSKVRPAIIVSTDRNNATLDDVIVAAVSRSTRGAAFTHVKIDPVTPDGQLTGLIHVCYIQCENLFALDKGLIRHRLGTLSPALRLQLDACLKAALDLP
jgi:mRNA-degrading endonuclease toxin of MazEF toxin-antitoxin module